MSPKKPDPDKINQIVAEARREQEQREKGYRERALRIYPHVCARCGREFSGKRLKELTVHHKDGNHENNPNDGSNWELLCLYCHDNEHSRSLSSYEAGTQLTNGDQGPRLTHRPFENLKALLGNDESKGEE
ncbi:MAG: YajD family HNH nuclease [Chloroflexota bacterium]|nr:YajD family HNH nuclease [Chloroflexota bacterium]